MSQNDHTKPTSTGIKIAAKDASQRISGPADPGPGDVSAAPSEAPQLVDIPEPPTASQLVVKSTNAGSSGNVASMNATTSHGGTGSADHGASASGTRTSGPKSIIMASMKHSSNAASQMGPAASNKSDVAAKESTSSRPLSNPSGHKSHGSSGAPKSATRDTGGPKSATKEAGLGGPGLSAANAGPTSEPGATHDVDEEGEGEVDQPEEGGTGPSSPAVSGLRPGSATSSPGATEPVPSSKHLSIGKPSSAASSKHSSPTSSPSSHHRTHKGGHKKKKVTRFRYHKRVTVRTTGKTSPSTIMSKVNKKDHKVGITPSAIEDMDSQELMKRAGIKGSQQTHWRVRLRQTKRLTKDGKTTTQTKVAYRDSEGNKRIKTSSTPFCKTCGKKLEDCKCDSTSQS